MRAASQARTSGLSICMEERVHWSSGKLKIAGVVEFPDGMRHVKLRPGQDIDTKALITLIERAYTDMKRRLKAG